MNSILLLLLLTITHLGDCNLPFLGSASPYFLSNFLDFVIKSSLLVQVPDFVFISLVLEILSFFVSH
jgi:hypothetical protein